MLLLEKQFQDFFQWLFDWAQKYFCPQSEASVYLLIGGSLPAICKLDCSPYLSGSFRIGKLPSRRGFSVSQWKWAPEVYSTSFIRSPCIIEEKKLTNFTKFKCEKNFSCTLMFTNLPSINPQSNFFHWCIFCFALFCWHAKLWGKISVTPYISYACMSPLYLYQLLKCCMHNKCMILFEKLTN